MSTVSECRKARGNAKGSVTRAGNTTSVMLKSDAHVLDLAAIIRTRESLERGDDIFQLNHERLFEEFEQMEPDDYYQELEEHNKQVLDIRAQLVSVEARLNAAHSLAQVEAAISDLELTAREGFTAQLLVLLPEARKLFTDFQKASAHASIAKDVELRKNREALSSRYATIFKICETHLPSPTPPGSVPLVAPSRPAAAPPSSIKAVIPEFDGKMEHWRTFVELFDSILETNRHLTSQQKRALLVKAMSSPEAAAHAQSALELTTTYEEALEVMRERYDDPVQLHLHHVTQYFRHEKYTTSRDDMLRLHTHLQENMAGMKATGGFTAEKIMAAHGATLLPHSHLVKWKWELGKTTAPPTQTQLIAFVKSMIHASADLPSCPARVLPPSPTTVPPRKRLLPKPPTRSAMALRRSVECRVCAGDHSVFGCSKMMDMNVAERLQWAQEAQACLNCFSLTHATDRCGSSNRCRVCHQSHHMLIH